MLQYAYYGKDRSIHSCGQMEHYGNMVNDRSMKVGGNQCIITLDGYVIPLDIINGLPYMKTAKHTDEEWDTLPKVVLTSPKRWNPMLIDYRLTERDDWKDLLSDFDKGIMDKPIDQFGNYRKRQEVQLMDDIEEARDEDIDDSTVSSTSSIEADETDMYEVSFADMTPQKFRQCYAEACDLNKNYVYPDEEDTVTTACCTDYQSDGDSTSLDEAGKADEELLMELNVSTRSQTR
jgi:hypothetical protein